MMPAMGSVRQTGSFSGRETRLGMALSILVLGLAAVGYPQSGQWSPQLTGLAGIGLAALAFATIPGYHWPYAYLVRTAVLAAPGLVCTIPLLMMPELDRIGWHGLAFQTQWVAARIMFLTLMALGASGLAWGLSIRTAPHHPVPVNRRPFHIRFLFYFFISLIFGALTAITAGPFVWLAAYGTAGEGPILQLGITPTLSVIGVLGMAAHAWFDPRATRLHRYLVFGMAAYVGIYCMFLRGIRLEPVAMLTGLYFMYLFSLNRRVSLLRILVYCAALFMLVMAWGGFRSNAEQGATLADSLGAVSMLQVSEQGETTLNAATISDIGATFFNILGLTDEGALAHTRGRTYLEFLARTPPAFLYPDRPPGSSFLFWSVGETSGGGMYELAEAYYNFGVLGILLVPALITFFIARVQVRAVQTRTPFAMLAIGLLIALSYRGIWYETFNYYKPLVTWLILEGGLLVFTEFVRRPVAVPSEPASGPQNVT